MRLTVYHGSNAAWENDTPNLENIGSGLGVCHQGNGIYFGSNLDTVEKYRHPRDGKLYQADIVIEEDKMPTLSSSIGRNELREVQKVLVEKCVGPDAFDDIEELYEKMIEEDNFPFYLMLDDFEDNFLESLAIYEEGILHGKFLFDNFIHDINQLEGDERPETVDAFIEACDKIRSAAAMELVDMSVEEVIKSVETRIDNPLESAKLLSSVANIQAVQFIQHGTIDEVSYVVFDMEAIHNIRDLTPAPKNHAAPSLS